MTITFAQEAKQELFSYGTPIPLKLYKYKNFLKENNQVNPQKTTEKNKFFDEISFYDFFSKNIEENLKLVENFKIIFQNIQQAIINLNTQLSYLSEPLEKASSYFNEPKLNNLFIYFNEIIKCWNEKLIKLFHDLLNQTIHPLNGLLNSHFDKLAFNAKENLESFLSSLENRLNGKTKSYDRYQVILRLCEYLKLSNEIKEETCIKLSRGISNFYQNQTIYFHESCKILSTHSGFFDQIDSLFSNFRAKQKFDRTRLDDIVDSLKSDMFKNDLNSSLSNGADSSTCSASDTNSPYQLHQPKINTSYGTSKSGYLLKHSSKSRVRKNWLKRKCVVNDGILSIYHSDEFKQPVVLNLVTCQIKNIENKRFKIYSGSNSRVYEFMAESDKDLNEWVSVLNNSKREALDKELSKDNAGESMKELVNNILRKIKKLDGNNSCCDCNANDPEWLVTNLGIFICIECCGIHRELGVHISKTQSIKIDHLTSSQLIIARMIGNAKLNRIFEANLSSFEKLNPHSQMESRRKFIKLKYESHNFSSLRNNNEILNLNETLELINQKNFTSLFEMMLQWFSHNINLLTPIELADKKRNLLMLIIINFDDMNVLHLIDFIIQNRDFNKSFTIDYQDQDGNTALHYCSQFNRIESIRLLLKAGANFMIKNRDGFTSLDIAFTQSHNECIKHIRQAIKNEKIDSVDWIGLFDEDYLSDTIDEQDGLTPRSRPLSVSSLYNFTSPSEMSIDATENEPSSYRENYKTKSHQRVLSDSMSLSINQMQNTNLGRVKVLPIEHELRHTEKSSYKFFKKISSVSTSNLSISKQFNSSITTKKPISSSSSNDLLYDENYEKHKKSLKIDSRSPTYKKRTATTINYTALNSFKNFKCKAIKNYNSNQLNHLSFEQNDTIVLLDNTNKEYWHGYIESDPSRSGYFPSSYVNLYL